MKTKTHVRAGKIAMNHNPTVRQGTMQVKTGIRAGRLAANHNATAR
jgi:hypothetical protein